MNNKYHTLFALLLMLTITILGIPHNFNFGLPLIGIIGVLGINIGILLSQLFFSSDNDSPNSQPVQNWGPLKVLFRPFSKFGHREVLHHWFWGPFILVHAAVDSLWIVTKLVQEFIGYDIGIEFSASVAVGMVLNIWLHIIVDAVYSSKVGKLIRKVVHACGLTKLF